MAYLFRASVHCSVRSLHWDWPGSVTLPKTLEMRHGRDEWVSGMMARFAAPNYEAPTVQERTREQGDGALVGNDVAVTQLQSTDGRAHGEGGRSRQDSGYRSPVTLMEKTVEQERDAEMGAAGPTIPVSQVDKAGSALEKSATMGSAASSGTPLDEANADSINGNYLRELATAVLLEMAATSERSSRTSTKQPGGMTMLVRNSTASFSAPRATESHMRQLTILLGTTELIDRPKGLLRVQRGTVEYLRRTMRPL